MKKPPKIETRIWNQHRQWMTVVREGATTGITPRRPANAISTK